MKITSGALQMNSSRKYERKISQLATGSKKNVSTVYDSYIPSDGKDNTTGYDMSKLGDFGARLLRADENIPSKSTDRTNKTNMPKGFGEIPFDEMNLQMQFSSINYILRIFFGGRGGNDITGGNLWNAMMGGYRTESYSLCQVYEEKEETSFETDGTVKTEDGRELNFNLKIKMSRSFYEETNLSITRMSNPLIDPLVINVKGNPESVSDQTFYFDLDADGTLDKIPKLEEGSGFLALDKDENGTIDDGRELFGTKSGDGFKELSEYDLDGNGWIDEADEIFDKLKVWSIDENGSPRLFTLKEADIGAICLASAPTDFSVTNEYNDTRAMVRKTGMFLHESTGMAGAVQQIDLAKMAV